jgi:hypothetical protein
MILKVDSPFFLKPIQANESKSKKIPKQSVIDRFFSDCGTPPPSRCHRHCHCHTAWLWLWLWLQRRQAHHQNHTWEREKKKIIKNH